MKRNEKGKIVEGGDNSNPTTITQFSASELAHIRELPLSELESIRNHAIEHKYDPTLNEFQKRALQWVIDWIESLICQRSGMYYLVNSFSLPSELEHMVYSSPKEKLGNKPQCDFKIEDWESLIIKINVYDTTFHNVGSSSSCSFTLKQLKWTGLKLEILKDLSVGVYKPRSQQVNNAISQLNKQISYMVGMDIHPIETMGRGKSQYRVSNVKIELYDADERLMDAQKKTDRVYFSKNYDDGYQRDALQRHISVDEDDID